MILTIGREEAEAGHIAGALARLLALTDNRDSVFQYQGCLTGETQTGPTGTAACGQIGSATSNGTNSGLDNPQSLAKALEGHGI